MNSEADTINEIKQMSRVKSKYTVRCYGYSLVDQANDDVAIVMEYGGELSPHPHLYVANGLKSQFELFFDWYFFSPEISKFFDFPAAFGFIKIFVLFFQTG